MAQYKVPQDVEAEDKLLGPFTFRQFVYLLITGGLIAAAVGLFQIFPVLAIIPVPLIILFGALALPLKKDQPMETYLAAMVSYYLKPRTKIWHPGQRDTAIVITAPKIVEEVRSRDISGEEATNRLSFLAEIVDSEGRAIKENGGNSNMRDDLAAEANATEDMFETHHFDSLKTVIAKDEATRHDELVKSMQESISKTETLAPSAPATISHSFSNAEEASKSAPLESPTVVQPTIPPKTASEKPVKPSIIKLANDKDLSVATIAKEAKRINGKDDGEVFISLH